MIFFILLAVFIAWVKKGNLEFEAKHLELITAV